MNLRSLEKTKKFGFIFFIQYNGLKFDCFDENPNKKSTKKQFINILNELGFTWSKGVQQAARTDAEVSCDNNILYVSSNYSKNLEELKNNFNSLSDNLKINDIKKTLPNLVLPDYIKNRTYKYYYPEKKLKNEKDLILSRCTELSGEYDVSIFSDNKGKELKEKVRKVEVTYKDDYFYFKGNSFMPKQIRNMMGKLIYNKIKTMPGKYLKLENVNINLELRDNMFKVENRNKFEIEKIELIEKIESSNNLTIFYVLKRNKGEFIGKKGKNIKKLRKSYGEVIIREI